ncbi:MAG: hypothetical protein M1823_004939 [Watsoniomyces obsoletus]|nr:MAG: hypothetical protein M1823_004939 [Watsoniomyces obsoletus]
MSSFVKDQEVEHRDDGGDGVSTKPPPPPDPASDAHAATPHAGADVNHDAGHAEDQTVDIFTLTSDAALKMMCASLETIIEVTGDIAPTPPPSAPSTPNMRAIQVEKEETVRYHARASQEGSRANTPPPNDLTDLADLLAQQMMMSSCESLNKSHVRLLDADLEVLSVQHQAILRKFYSKVPPPITLAEYLLRMHQYCPMSTAVVLATSLYVHRLALVERVMALTPRNVHRLLLGGLVTAMKALEDQTWPHSRLAKVGGVSATELGRLEISFCFVTNFDLKVDARALSRHAAWLQSGGG